MSSIDNDPTSSAPHWVVYCARCGGRMETQPYDGRPRRRCGSCGYVYFTDPKVGVGVMVVDGDRLLLIRRSMNPGKGKWSIPAGYLDHGEDPAAAAAREAYEETGLAVTIEGLVDVYHNPPGEGGASIFILYRACCVGGELRAGDDADEAAFFALDALPELAFASTQAAIGLLRRDG